MNETQYPIAQARILIIDDDEDDFWLIRDFIQDIPQQQFQIEWCPDYKKASAALQQSSYDIYFVDYHLGAKTGIDLLKEAQVYECKEPIILLTGQGNQKIDLEAMRSGAVDYLIKSQLTSEQLDRCIRYSLERAAILRESRASERKYRTIFERSRDLMFVTDMQLNINEVNLAALDLFGYSPDELLNTSLANLFVDHSDKDSILDKLRDRSEVVDQKIELLSRDQSRKRCILSASRESDSAGNPYVQGIIHDVSLLERVEEIRLQSEKLETKGMFIRTLAHEIRNPLHNIILSLGFLKTDATDENQQFLDVIDRNSKRINDLINELMDSNQYHKMKLEVLPLQEVINEALDMAVDHIQLRKVKVDLSFPPANAYALVDKEKAKTAFLNIIVNAIEAMSEGGSELKISICSGVNVHKIHIRDNGCGISPENIARLFEPYFTTKQKGMGLGLAATNAILQSHKADIEVLSVINEGTTFTITFPAL